MRMHSQCRVVFTFTCLRALTNDKPTEDPINNVCRPTHAHTAAGAAAACSTDAEHATYAVQVHMLPQQVRGQTTTLGLTHLEKGNSMVSCSMPAPSVIGRYLHRMSDEMAGSLNACST